MTAFEVTVTVALLMAFLGIAAVQQRQVIRRARELALEAELKNLRASLVFFEAARRRRPASLEELQASATERVRAGGGHPGARASDSLSGQDTDAFGNLYAYDALTGTIRSRTRGYESW
jgi:hypothetical protein